VVWEGRTPSREQWVRVLEDRDGQQVVAGDAAGTVYGGIGIEELTVTADGRHLAYPARVGERWTVVHDGHELGRWSGVGELRFSPDGSRLAFSVERDGHWYVVVDGRAGPELDGIFAETLQWSANGRALVYAGSRQGLAHVVLDQALGPAFDGIGRLIVGDAGTRTIYAGRRADGWHVIDGTSAGPACPSIVELAMSPNQQHVAYVSRSEPDEGLVVDSVGGAPYRQGRVSSLFVDDRGRLTFVATRDGSARVVHDAVAGPLFDEITKLVVTRAGHYAYLGRRGAQTVAMVDGTAHTSGDAIEDLSVAPDGRRFAFLLRRDKQWIVVCDGRQVTFDRAIAGSLVWSRDSRHWGVLAGEIDSRRIFISVDGTKQRPFDMRELVLLAEKRPGASAAQATRALQELIAGELDLAARR
jgi:dipeptidyl aminopeptidase/acylaminoacyl peptidase